MNYELSAPIDGNPAGKNILSMTQFSAEDIQYYVDEAYAAEALVHNSESPGTSLLPFKVLKAVMRQPSTRTAGTMTTAMAKLGGTGELISGMQGSSEAKGESLEDSWVAFATQADVIGTRTAEEHGPLQAATAINKAVMDGNLEKNIPIINLGDGRNEHPSQTLGDLFTIHKIFKKFEGLKLAVVGDHERYRAFHSLLIGAFAVGMELITVESQFAPIPDHILKMVHPKLTRTSDLDAAMRAANILYIGRNPDEYNGDDELEKQRTFNMNQAYSKWIIGRGRLQQMSADSVVLHPRPRRNEMKPNADADPRTRDIQQMVNMIPMRMAILANAFGKQIREAA